MSQRIVSWWKYNPILQKPTSLDAVKPWSWYWYYGPDPVSGLSYGQYHDEDFDFDMLSQKKQVVYSPATGKPMKLIEEVSGDEVDDMFSKAKGCLSSEPKVCTSCDAKIVSDYDLKELGDFYCYNCGKECGCEESGESKETKETKETIAEKQTTEKKTMKKEMRSDRVRSLKRKIRASLLKKRKVAAKSTEEKEEKKVTKVVDREQLRRRAAIASRMRMRDLDRKRKVRAEEEEKKEKEEDDELISLDTIMESMEEEEAKENEVEDVKKEDDDLVSLDEVMEAMNELEDEGSFEDEGLEDEGLDDLGDEEVEDEGLEEENLGGEPKSEEDEYYDLDMVLSMINKREKLARRRKKVRAEDDGKETEKDKAKLEEKEGEEKVEEKVEKAPEATPLVKTELPKTEAKPIESAEEKEECDEEEKPEGDKEKPEGESDEEPNMATEESPLPAMPVEMDAMRFEPLASIANLAKVNKDQIDMTLYNEESENPTWNVAVSGVPTARIQLKNQMHPEEIRSVFCSDDYAKDLMIHCEKTGFIPIMNKVKAEFWSNHTSNKKLAERFTKEAKASLESERKKLLATFKQDFRSCINVVSAGMAKNFYPDMGNPLKEHLFANLRSVGLPEQTAISVVEKSFSEGAAPYFSGLFEKSEEYMGLSSDTRKEIAAAISHGSSLAVENASNEIADAEVSLSDRLAHASVIASVTNPNLRVNNDLVMDTNEYKAQLKSVFRK